ncbi:MAG: CPBP family intramembrane metalloprotease [Acidobacteriota bacterium]|nr:CPBP family intramembrane metalloprotease [Acidobacteriota bacterium]
MPVKLKARQYIIIAAAVAVSAVSLVIALKYFSRAFPEATLHLRVDRGESGRIARDFLAARGFRLAGYQHAAAFQYDDTAKLYLERTQGLRRMNQLTSGPVHLWRWTHRWFRPQQKEEFSVDVTPSGQVVGFSHEIAEDAAGASLSQDAARKIAESFLAGVMKRDPAALEFLEAARLKRPHRTDYTFTWKQKDVNLGKGSLRVEVDVDGDQVAGISEYVKVPEEWVRGYEKIRSHNDAAQEVDQVFWVLLSLAMLIILVRRLRDRDVRLRLSVALGVVAAVLAFLSQINNFPLAKFSYNTTDSFSSFLASYAFMAVLGAAGLGALIFLVVASSEPVYRESLPRMLSFRRYFSWRGLRTRSFFMASIVGIALTFFFFAYQTVFYLAANHFGAWAPADIPFSNQLNTAIPWAAVLFTGFFPAVSEEMQFRAFAIPFLRKLTRSWPLALVLAAFNWGFLHSAYPNQPFFIRGVEVGVGGIIIGVVMLRFGIIATLMWHYSVDALYTAFLLLRSSNHYLMVSGGLSAGVMLIPLGVALAAYLRTGTFTEEAPLTNASEGVSRAPQAAGGVEAEAVVPYQRFSSRRLWAALIVIAVCAAIGSAKIYHLGEGIRIRSTRLGATETAKEFLRTRGVNLAAYHSVAWLDDNVDRLALRYFLQRLSVRKADQAIREASQPVLWAVRFYRPLQTEEHYVFVSAQNGKVFASQHVLAETAPGVSLSAAPALALGEQTVTAHGYKLSDFTLQDSIARKRPAREDYTLIWQAKPGDPRNVGDAHYRLEVDIAGNQVTGFLRQFKLPEKWVRQQETRGLAGTLLPVAAAILGVGLLVGAIWLFVLQVKRGAVRWMAALKAAIVLAIILALSGLNDAPLIDRSYNTSLSLSNFHLQAGVSFVVLVIFGGVLLWLLLALATSLYPQSWQLLTGFSRRIWSRDAAITVVVALAAGAGVGKVLTLLANHFHAVVPIAYPGPPAGWAAISPGLGIFFRAVVAAVGSAAVLGVVIYGVKLGWGRRAWWFWLGLALLLVALIPSGVHTESGLVLGWTMRLIPLVVTVVLLFAFFRDNILAYVAAAFATAALPPSIRLLTSPASFYRLNGVLLLALAAIALIWMLLPREQKSQPPPRLSR